MAVLALVVLLVPPGAPAQEISARAAADSVHVVIGDAIRVRVTLTHPAGQTFEPILGDTLGGFFVLGREEVRQDGETRSGAVYTVARYDSGETFLPPIPFLYSLPGDSAVRRVETNALRFVVHTVPVDTAADIRDLKAPMSIPLAWTDVLLIVAAVAAAALLVYVGYRFWKKRRAKGGEERPVPPARAAHVIALEQLGLLKDRRLWQQGLIKDFYVECTGIFRQYVENRYRQAALEQTTDEILAGLRRLHMPEDLARGAEQVLRRADLVKFAKLLPGIPEHEGTLKFVYDFVDRTKIVEATAVTPAPTGGRAHVGA
jgi:hypothetical protein